MWEKLRAHLSPPMGVALVAMFLALAGTTWAGTGGNFILGKSNTADHTTVLSAGTSGPALKSINTGSGPGFQGVSGTSNGIIGETTAPNVAGVYALDKGTSAGQGVHAVSLHGTGVSGQGAVAGGSFNSIGAGDGVQGASNAANKSGVYAHHDSSTFGYGVFSKAVTGDGVFGSGSVAGGVFAGQSTGDGLQGQSTALNKSGVWGHHDGSNPGYGVFAQSDAGPAIGMLGNKNAPPMTLDGNPFPSATAGYRNGDIVLPADGIYHPMSAMGNIVPGTYIIIATLQVVISGNSVGCTLTAGGDSDYKLVGGDVNAPITLMVFHKFTSTGVARIDCVTSSSDNFVYNQKIAAIQVAGGTNTQLP